MVKKTFERWERSFWKRVNRLRKYIAKKRGKTIVHLIHIGKTGGSAVKYVLEQNKSTPSHEIFLHGHAIGLQNIEKGERIIFFLRDPIKRFISAFYGRQREDRPRYYSPWSKEEREAFETFATPNELARALSSMDDQFREKAIKAMRNIAHIRNSYWDWFCNENYMLSRKDDIYFIGTQENLSEDFFSLKKLLELPEDATLPTDSINAHRNPSNIDKALDEEAIKNLENWYKRDYDFIDFCQENFIRNINESY